MLTETIEALGLPLDAVIEPAAGGASGDAWRVRAADGTYALRLSWSREQTDGRLAAMAAARDAGLPAPELIRRAFTVGGEAVLLSWLPGITMLDALVRDPPRVRDWARLAGVMQRRLHAIRAPDAVLSVHDDDQRPFGAGRDLPGLPDGQALLHLDWHPLNLLVDEAAHAITGIVDWDNARRGHPSLDLARTRAMLTFEPVLATLPTELRTRRADFLAGWTDGYGPADVPLASQRWAGRVMLADLAPRYASTPGLLDPLRTWIDSMEG